MGSRRPGGTTGGSILDGGGESGRTQVIVLNPSQCGWSQTLWSRSVRVGVAAPIRGSIRNSEARSNCWSWQNASAACWPQPWPHDSQASTRKSP